MLKAHFDAVEDTLLARSKIAGNTGHSLHKGTPRENFVSEFLSNHLSTTAAISSGEIISAESRPGDKRNQFDIIVYKSRFPRIEISSNVSSFLCESVIATIEVKSTLTKAELEVAVLSAHNAKSLKRNTDRAFATGYLPPGILSFIVAYGCHVKIETIAKWIIEIERKHSLNAILLPATQEERIAIASQSLEGIFILGKGSLLFDNSPLSLMDDLTRATHPKGRWIFADQTHGNLLWLFLLLSCAVEAVAAEWVDWPAYLQDFTTNCGLVP